MASRFGNFILNRSSKGEKPFQIKAQLIKSFNLFYEHEIPSSQVNSFKIMNDHKP